MADNAIQQMNHHSADNGQQNVQHYPPDRDLFSA